MASDANRDNANAPPLVPSRKRRPQTWSESQKKAKRDSGEGCVDRSGAVVEEKRVGPACTCKNKCYEKVGVENVNCLFKAYWALKNHDLQSQYINARVHTEEIARPKGKGRETRKKQGRTYTVVVDNVPINVCFIAFLNIHAITDKQVQNMLAKASLSPNATPATDQHGHQEPSNAMASKIPEMVEEFCKEVTTCQSHSSKARSSGKVSLPLGYTWTNLYELFQDYMEEEGLDRNAVILSQFIAKVQDYKISISAPKSNTCSTCDSFRIQFESLDPVADKEKIASPTLNSSHADPVSVDDTARSACKTARTPYATRSKSKRRKAKNSEELEKDHASAEHKNELQAKRLKGDEFAGSSPSSGIYTFPAWVKEEPPDETHTLEHTDDQVFIKQEVIYKEEVFGVDENVENQVIYPLPNGASNESSASTSLGTLDCSELHKCLLRTKPNSISHLNPPHIQPNSTVNSHILEKKKETLVLDGLQTKMRMSRDLLENMLPSIYNHKVITCDYMSDNNIPGLNLEIDSTITTMEDIKYWLQEFSERTCTSWKYSYGMGSLNRSCKVMIVCNGILKSKRERGKGEQNCKAFIHIRLNEENDKKDKKIGAIAEGFSSRITLSFVHNHPVVLEEALDFKNIRPDVIENFRYYFCEGHSPASAFHYHQTRLWLRDLAAESLYDDSINPKLRTVRYMWESWKRDKRQKPFRTKSNGNVKKSLIDAIIERLQKLKHEKKVEYLIVKNIPCITIVTPMMKRAHTTPEAGLTVYVDTVNGGHDKGNITYVTCATATGVLPLGVVITGNVTCDYRIAFKNLSKLVGQKAFGSRGAPVIFIVDGFESCKEALKDCFPGSQVWICASHLLRLVWGWLSEVSNGIKEQDRTILIGLVKNILYAPTPELSSLAYKMMLAHSIFRQYSVFKTYMATLWNRRGDIGLFYKLPILNKEFNDLSKRIFRDAILNRCRSFSLLLLIDFVCIAVEECFQQRVTEFIENTACQLTFLSCLDSKSFPEIKTTKSYYKVNSISDQNIWHTVDPEPSICSCESGRIGGFCEHQRAVWKITSKQPLALPALDTSDKLRFAKVAFGGLGYERFNKIKFDMVLKLLKENLARLEGIASQNITNSFIGKMKKLNEALGNISNLDELGKFCEYAGNIHQPNGFHTHTDVIQPEVDMLQPQISIDQPQKSIVEAQTSIVQSQSAVTEGLNNCQTRIVQPSGIIESQSSVGVGPIQFFVVQSVNK
ncbi:uncharacterized protein LOC134780313 [Penaeus indicus]|uniref:uncharacterized protein LOC134780313 n=1 Tax=Penaeus indicus TaxID=29960 RepID=UPI00300D4BBE